MNTTAIPTEGAAEARSQANPFQSLFESQKRLFATGITRAMIGGWISLIEGPPHQRE